MALLHPPSIPCAPFHTARKLAPTSMSLCRSQTFKAFYAVGVHDSITMFYFTDRVLQTIRSLRHQQPTGHEVTDLDPSDNVSVRVRVAHNALPLIIKNLGFHPVHTPRQSIVTRHQVIPRLVWPPPPNPSSPLNTTTCTGTSSFYIT